MQNFKWIFQLSRPRFWFYVIGPVLLAIAAMYSQELGINGKDSTNDWLDIIIVVLFFSLPANLLIYGVNDLFDYETDKNNEKKKSYEVLLEPANRTKFLKIFSAIVIPSLFVLLWVLIFDLNTGTSDILDWKFRPNSLSLWSLVGFLFFGIFYSMPPIRAKTKPFLDAFFNILYVFPGLLAYSVLTDEFPPVSIILAATFWVMAMHAFSAVPDIEADKRASIRTIATVLGRNATIILCAALYITSAVYAFEYIGFVSYVGAIIYTVMMFLAYTAKTDKKLFAVYKMFPYVNMAFGFILFWTVYLINS
jgi:lycopene elongase/hydratase (dihydrobisanhydrobacterioruberin-forming)